MILFYLFYSRLSTTFFKFIHFLFILLKILFLFLRSPISPPQGVEGFSRGLFAKRPTTRAVALFLPRRYIFCNPAPQRLLVRPAFTPRPYPGSPPVLPYACPRRLRRRPTFVPPARDGTPCAPSVPSRGIRRPARSGGGYRPGMGPVWRQHRRQFTQKGSIEPAAALAAVRCRPRRIYKVFREAFLQKGRHPRRSALSAAPPVLCSSAPRISALTNRRRCGRISLPADPECNTVRRRTQ